MPNAAVARQTCFVDMPFGSKVDPKSGVTIDFDQIYEQGIEPAVSRVKLQCIRGDREETGGIIHTAMFARLLMSEFVIADMTGANPNVFYELGVRHAARPYSTIPLFATLGAPPFDVNGVRAIPYELTDGKLAPDAAASLVDAIEARIRAALRPPVANDSPLFQLFAKFPGINMDLMLTEVFRDRVARAEEFRNTLAAARALRGDDPADPSGPARQALDAIWADLGDVATADRGVVVDLMLSYRAIEAFDRMIALYDAMSGELQSTVLARQQLAFARNRRNQGGDRDAAVALLEGLLASHGDTAETLGLLGRIYKDRYKEATGLAAEGWLDRAIETYTRGFEAEPLEFFPGVNALTLLLMKTDDDAAAAEMARLLPLVTFAALRRGGEKSTDYWAVATVLELACIGRDFKLARRCLPRMAALAPSPGDAWMLKSSRSNLVLIASRHEGADAQSVRDVIGAIDVLLGQLAAVAPAAPAAPAAAS